MNISHISQHTAQAGWRETAMEQLVGVVQSLSQARDMETVMVIVREAARSLTQADGATFVLRDGDYCYYADENAISPLWKGRRFLMDICISGWVMMNAKPIVIEDIYSDPRVPAEAYRPTFVKSLAMVPIRRQAPIGAIGNYWANCYLPNRDQMDILQALADTTSVALENIRLYDEQKQHMQVLKEREARIAKQRETLEVFARALAHDLREPVRAVQSFGRLLGKQDVPAGKKPEYLQVVNSAADRLSQLIESVSQYLQLEEAEQKTGRTCSMNAVLAAAREDLAEIIRESGANITAQDLPDLQADPAHMLQVVRNLLTNAIRHGGTGVQIHLQAEEREEDWVVSVRDNGPGIPQEYCERIFLPFKRLTALKGSSGMGLAICRKIIDGYRGKIWCVSQSGRGAAFFFSLPKAAKSPPTRREDTPLATVLLVDDDESDIELAQLMMLDRELLQCNLLIARSGREAIKVLENSLLAGSHAIDLVLLDINMPGLDGFEVLEHIRADKALKSTPVVMCTGSTYEKDLQKAESLRIEGYLVKPASFEQLKAIVNQIATLELLHQDGRNSLRCVRQRV